MKKQIVEKTIQIRISDKATQKSLTGILSILPCIRGFVSLQELYFCANDCIEAVIVCKDNQSDKFHFMSKEEEIIMDEIDKLLVEARNYK